MTIIMRCAGVLLFLSAAAFAANDPKTQLTVNDSGKIYFSSAGSIAKTNVKVAMAVQATPITLSGELAFPDGAGPFPAVILAHGCAGNGYSDVTWAPMLRKWGYATFVVDSFGGRSISIQGICEDVTRLFPVRRVPDVYGALRILATHPKISADRVALMGFSHGGIVTLSASTQWARDMFAPNGRPSFRAFFPFYPYCNSVVPEYDAVSAPVRIHTGALDDWTPAKPCQDWTERLRSKGFDASVTLYPEAHHAFDDPTGSPIRLPKVVNVSTCTPRFKSILGPSEADDPFAGCLKYGATIGRNVQAIKAAQEALHPQLDMLLGSK
jgi:dienelactone hydrolase